MNFDPLNISGRRQRALAIGDSHVRIFESRLFRLALPNVKLEIAYVPGATASGIHNARSRTGALVRFREALESGPYDFIVITLGEVDTAYTIWLRAETTGRSIDELLAVAVARYCTFLDTLEGPVFVISAPLPTIGDDSDCDDEVNRVRQTVHASIRDRTALALRFNESVREHCSGNESLIFIDLDALSLGRDGVVRRGLRHPYRPCEHHYFRPTYALLLGASLVRERLRLSSFTP